LYILKDSQTRHYGFADENSTFDALSKRMQSGKNLIFPPSAMATNFFGKNLDRRV